MFLDWDHDPHVISPVALGWSVCIVHCLLAVEFWGTRCPETQHIKPANNHYHTQFLKVRNLSVTYLVTGWRTLMEISKGCWWDLLSPEGLNRTYGTASKVDSFIQLPEGVLTCVNFSERKTVFQQGNRLPLLGMIQDCVNTKHSSQLKRNKRVYYGAK